MGSLSSMGEFYVYVYRNPLKNDEIFYVGKGKGSRKSFHLDEAKKSVGSGSHKTNTIKSILTAGLEPVIEIIDEQLDEAVAFELEMFLISEIGRRDLGTGTLTNLTSGGEGSSGYIHSTESKAKISEKLKGREITPENKERLSNLFKNGGNPMLQDGIAEKTSGANHWNFGKPAVNKGIPMSEEQKKLLSEVTSGDKHWNYGKTHSAETVAKMTGLKRSEETKLRMRKPKAKHKCIYCGTLCAPHIINRFHNENCKEKNV